MNDLIIRLIEGGGYWGIALLMCLENVFPPLPSEIIMGLAGIEVARGQMSGWAVVTAGSLGSLAGNWFWLWVGRSYGLARVERFVDRWGRWMTLDSATVAKLNSFFHRHGSSAIFFGRMLPNVRTMISLPAGLFRMSRLRFAIWTLAGTAIWNTALVAAGYQLGANVERIDDYTGPISLVVIGSILAIYIWRLIAWRPQKTQDSGGD